MHTSDLPDNVDDSPSATCSLLSEFDSHLQHLLQGHSRFSRHCLARGDAPPAISTWLRCLLKKSPCESEAGWLPAAMAANWHGWMAYNRFDLSGAVTWFHEGMKCEPTGVARVELPLGLGKVGTRTGQWRVARDWLLLSLAEARRADRLYDTVRVYGALGELLLRAGHSADAYFCLSTAHRLLPPGAGERSKQLSYLASALMRLGTRRDLSDAESLLMTSLYLALDNADTTSAWHALARLQFLELDRGGERDVLMLADATPTPGAASVGEGFLNLGRAFAAYRRNDTGAARQFAGDARFQLAGGYPMEAAWAARVDAALGGDATAPRRVLKDIPPCPAATAAIDSDWQRLPLSDDGFSPLFKRQRSLRALLNLREVFFL